VKDPAKPTLPGWSWHTRHQRSQMPKTWQVYFKEEDQTDSTDDIDFQCSHDAVFSKCSFHVLYINTCSSCKPTLFHIALLILAWKDLWKQQQ
jgi:hypothetical protein